MRAPRQSSTLRVKRRECLTLLGNAVAWPLAAHAQQPATPVIGFLNGAAYELSRHLVQAFHQGLSETGLVEGRNVTVEYRSAEGKYDRLPALAADLVRRKVDVIVATGTPTGLPAKAATTAIPIVFVTGSDPVEQGLVANLARPEGNLTGATTLAAELGQKWLELLRELVPSLNVVGVLINPRGPNLKSVMRDVEAAARILGLRTHILHASSEPEIDKVFAALEQVRVGGLVIGTDTFFNSQSGKLGALTRRHAVPAVYQYREFVAAGGLTSYAGAIGDAYRVAGVYTGRILRGEKPANLPVQQSPARAVFVEILPADWTGSSVIPPKASY